jgi:hypothetical protein
MQMSIIPGNPLSIIDTKTADQLGLQRHDLSRSVGPAEGYVFAPVRVGEANFGTVRLFVFPSDRGVPANSSLGWDVLSKADLDFDFPNGKFNVFSPKHCEGKVVYWTKDPYAKVSLVPSYGPLFAMDLDGEEIGAIIDPTTPRTWMPLRNAKRIFHWKENPPELTLLSDVKPVDPYKAVYRYPFKMLSVKDLEIRSPAIDLQESTEPQQPSFLYIGMNTLRQTHIYMAPRDQKAYLTVAPSVSPRSN